MYHIIMLQRVSISTKPRLPIQVRVQRRARTVPTAALNSQDIVYGSEILGKGIILFTMFYCGFNYLYYKEARERMEEQQKKDNEKDRK